MQTLEAAQELRIDTIELRKATMVLRAINHPLRQQMLKIIHQAGAMTVTELYVKLRLEQSVASQHLAILRSAALVATERKAKNIFYSVNTGRLDSVHSIVADLINGPVALPQPA
jgi:DNA-binding transcriptional ArsR family regulator